MAEKEIVDDNGTVQKNNEKQKEKVSRTKRAADKTPVENEENVVDISSYFTTSREREGVWFEPKIEDNSIGIKFKIVGPASDEYIKAYSDYRTAHEMVVNTEDDALAIELERKAICNFLNGVIKDFKPSAGITLLVNGKKLEYSKSIMEKILYESAEIRSVLFDAVVDSETFRKR